MKLNKALMSLLYLAHLQVEAVPTISARPTSELSNSYSRSVSSSVTPPDSEYKTYNELAILGVILAVGVVSYCAVCICKEWREMQEDRADRLDRTPSFYLRLNYPRQNQETPIHTSTVTETDIENEKSKLIHS